MSAWLPIETAPKDGTQILLFCAIGEKDKPPALTFCVVGKWHVPMRMTKRKQAGYWVDAFAGGVLPLSITHWMPLPQPPESQDE